MKILDQQAIIESPISLDAAEELSRIENAARLCYKSEPNGDPAGFCKKLIERHHLAMLEHSTLSVRFICDRGISHELVRHRNCSYAQESTRYCNYSKDKFGHEISVIKPIDISVGTSAYKIWESQLWWIENAYFALLDEGCSPQTARAILPNCLMTEIMVSTNYREWRHILKLRTASDAHPQMRALMNDLWEQLKIKIPVIFDTLDE